MSSTDETSHLRAKSESLWQRIRSFESFAIPGDLKAAAERALNPNPSALNPQPSTLNPKP